MGRYGPIIAIGMLLAQSVVGAILAAPCGSDPSDDERVTAVITAVEARCDCCVSSVRRCAAPIAKAAYRTGQLPHRCLHAVKRRLRSDCAQHRKFQCGTVGGCFDATAGVCTARACPAKVAPGYCPAGEVCRTDCPPGSGKLVWRATCGAPVCSYPSTPIPGLLPCTARQAFGAPCSAPGDECDPRDCDQRLVCSRNDVSNGGNCPISRRRYKTDIAYLTPADARDLHDTLMRFRLASYRYKNGADDGSHLGFIIDDVEPSPSVDASGDRVDLDGYTSMAVAALQTQAREIETLKAQVAALQQELTQKRIRRPR